MGSGQKPPGTQGQVGYGVMSGCGCLTAILGVILATTIVLIPIGVPLALIGGFAFGYGLKKLIEHKK